MSTADDKLEPDEQKIPERSKSAQWGQSILFLLFFIAVLFVPAGRLDWMAGWAFLGLFIVAVGIIAIWAKKHDPELMEERQTGAQAENVKSWDRVIMTAYTVLLISMLILASLDAGRFGWSDMPVFVRILGWFGLGAAFVIVWRVMAENTYLSERVRIQDERGHRVVSTGPYQYVRHPMYVGIIIAAISVPLVLGSWWALVPAVFIVLLFVVRSALEDRTLTEELPGYQEYAHQVRYKLIPGIW